MRALVIERPAGMRLVDAPRPSARAECLVRVRLAGICGTDLELLEGYADFQGIPGHEFVGRVEAADAEADIDWIGVRVVGEINVGCRSCEWCAAGEKEHCAARTVVGIRGRDGAFAEYVTLPASNLHALPDTIDDRTAVFVEPLAAACRIVEQVDVRDTSRVAVLGDGRLALLAAQVLRTHTRDVTLLGRHDWKMNVARALGFDARVPSTSDRRSFGIVVEATGSVSGLPEAIELTRPEGIVVMKSTVHGEAGLATWPIVVNEVTLVGSRCGPFPLAIALLATGAVEVAPLISNVRPLDDYEQAFADAKRGLKVLLDIG